MKFSVITLAVVAAVCHAAPMPSQDQPNIVELAKSVPDLSTLVMALQAGKLVTALSGPGPFTVFAPTNEAFAKLPHHILERLLEPKNIKELQAVLEYHVVAARAFSKDLKAGERIKTLEGANVTVTLAHDEVFINNAKVIKADVNASNGVVHLIDTVLIPQRPPQLQVGDDQKNIVELAESVPELSTLVTALKAGQLVTALSSKGPFTVFAPTNEAFEALPKGVLQKLLEPSNLRELQAVLEYHVAAGAVYSKDLKPAEQIKTLEGGNVTITLTHEGAFVNNAKVIKADVSASNGVVHLISRVLIPQH